MLLEEKKLQEELDKKKTRPFYFFFGEEAYKMETFLEKIISLVLPEGKNSFNLETYYGDELNPEAFLDSTNSFSFFQGKKIVLVKNADGINAKNWEKLKDLILAPPDHACLIFIGKKFDQRLKHVQSLVKSESATLVKCELVREQDLAYWVGQLAKRRDKKIDPTALSLLIEWCGPSLYEIDQTLEKAILYSGGNDLILEDHIRAVSVRTRPENIFAFTDSVLQQNRKAAMVNLEQLLEQGEDPIALVGLLARQYRWLLAVLALRAEGLGESQIASELKIFPRLAQNLFTASRRIGSGKILSGLNEITLADHAMKSSRELPRIILERLTLHLV